MNGKPVEPTPAQFDSYEEAAEFWDTARHYRLSE
jgi:hypothetical protein